MFRRTVSVLITAAMPLLSVSEVVWAESPSARDFQSVNEQLKGKVADIELADGGTIKKAKNVVMEPNYTHYKAKGKDQKVATDQVVRIRARKKSRALIAMGLGAAAVGLIVLGQNSCDPGDSYCSGSEAGAAIMGAGLGALVGFGISKAIPRKPRVVYEVSNSPAVEPKEDPTDADGRIP
jgi:hypothetical protein